MFTCRATSRSRHNRRLRVAPEHLRQSHPCRSGRQNATDVRHHRHERSDRRARARKARAREPLYAVDEALLLELRPDVIITQTQCEVCALSPNDAAQVMRSRTQRRSRGYRPPGERMHRADLGRPGVGAPLVATAREQVARCRQCQRNCGATPSRAALLDRRREAVAQNARVTVARASDEDLIMSDLGDAGPPTWARARYGRQALGELPAAALRAKQRARAKCSGLTRPHLGARVLPVALHRSR